MNGSGNFTRSWVVRIIIANTAIFLLQIFSQFIPVTYEGQLAPLRPVIDFYFGLRPILVVEKLYLWQFVTYMFLHGGMIHLFFNMYALLIFGIPVEQAWGGRRFVVFYFFTGIGAGITIFIVNTALGGIHYQVSTIGASGAVFGLLLAFGILFPNVEILLFFIIPIKAKYLVILYGIIELTLLVQSGGMSPISHAGHLGGLFFGLIYFLIVRKRGIKFKSKIIKARLKKEIEKRDNKLYTDESFEKKISLINILKKIEAEGTHSLTDDEFQYIKYMEIMMGDVKPVCHGKDYSIEDTDCQNCLNVEACILQKILKYF